MKFEFGNFFAEIIQDSLNNWGNRLITFRLRYPRFIHSEMMTHRMFSRNAASSRAIPLAANIANIEELGLAEPIFWTRNGPGMVATDEVDTGSIEGAKYVWQRVFEDGAKAGALRMTDGYGIHKSISNRIIEPWVWMDVILSATEFDNFFELRIHPDAQPEIKKIAELMKRAMDASESMYLSNDEEWHVPFINRVRDPEGNLRYYHPQTGEELNINSARMLSASICAQISFRKENMSLEKAQDIFHRLITSEPIHASPIEHQAKVMSRHQRNLIHHNTLAYRNDRDLKHLWETAYFVRNFQGFVQFRHILESTPL